MSPLSFFTTLRHGRGVSPTRPQTVVNTDANSNTAYDPWTSPTSTLASNSSSPVSKKKTSYDAAEKGLLAFPFHDADKKRSDGLAFSPTYYSSYNSYSAGYPSYCSSAAYRLRLFCRWLLYSLSLVLSVLLFALALLRLCAPQVYASLLLMLVHGGHGAHGRAQGYMYDMQRIGEQGVHGEPPVTSVGIPT